MNLIVSATQVALDEARIMGLDDALEYITDNEQVSMGCMEVCYCATHCRP